MKIIGILIDNKFLAVAALPTFRAHKSLTYHKSINISHCLSSLPHTSVLQQSQKGRWFHIRKLDFRRGRSHPTVEHGIKHRAPHSQNEPDNNDSQQQQTVTLRLAALLMQCEQANIFERSRASLSSQLTYARVSSEPPFLCPLKNERH